MVNMQPNRDEMIYQYVLAFFESYNMKPPAHQNYSLEQKNKFIESLTFVRCPACNRYYPGSILLCPSCKQQTFKRERKEFVEYILDCEQFRQDLRDASHINTIMYAPALKLYHYHLHPGA